MTKRLLPGIVPVALLALSCFLAPILGGYVDPLPLEPGWASLLAAVFGGMELPQGSMVVVALPMVAAVGWVAMRRQVLQVPHATLTGLLLLFLILLSFSLTVSEFTHLSMRELSQWLLYGVAFFAVILGAGRKNGPIAIVGGISAGCLVVALNGILEFGSMRSIDPSWRIFSLWVNPNALGAMLLVGWTLGVTLTAMTQRLAALLCGLGTVMIGFAIVLTQSKGVLAAAVPTLVVWTLLVAIWSSSSRSRHLARAGAIVGATALLGFALQLQAAADPQGRPEALGRLAGAADTQVQSEGFRRLLWQGSVQLIRENPLGAGIGTYRHVSSRPGLTTPTAFAHNSYLQLGVEAGLLAPIVLIAFGLAWLHRILRGSRSMAPEQNVLKAGVLAAVAGIATHALVDSDLHYFGIGFVLFALMGLGIQVAADAATPEFAPKGSRAALLAGALFAVSLAGYHALVEGHRSRVHSDLLRSDVASARQGLEGLLSIAPRDGESWYVAAQLAPSEGERLHRLERAASLAPHPRNYRALARQQLRAGNTSGAIVSARMALRNDPNNLPALAFLMDLHRQEGELAEATEVAHQLVEVEGKTYFQVRSIPQIVPTETFEARRFLAERSGDAAERAAWLRGAVEGYLLYRERTLPEVVRSHTVAGEAFVGESLQRARSHLESGIQAARELEQAYRELGDPGGCAWAASAEAELEAALSSAPSR
jgi:O-antigen ligase/tetratricopeptide (TPR) repeat protein